MNEKIFQIFFSKNSKHRRYGPKWSKMNKKMNFLIGIDSQWSKTYSIMKYYSCHKSGRETLFVPNEARNKKVVSLPDLWHNTCFLPN